MAERNPTNTIANWFIGFGVVGALALAWFAIGQPGVALADGDYGCWTGGTYRSPGPGATVKDGEVVEAWHFDISTGVQTSVPFSDVQRVDANKFTMTSEDFRGVVEKFECTP